MQSACRRLRLMCLLTIIAFYLSVGFAWLWPQDLTATGDTRVMVDHAAFMLRTFTFHGGVALLIIALFAFILKGRRTALWAAPGVLFAFFPLLSFTAPRPSPAQIRAAAAGTPTLTLMSANLLYINTDSADLLAQIATLDPDVIVFQEYTPAWDRVLTPALDGRYTHASRVPRDDCFGQAVFSRLPMTTPAKTFLPSNGYSWNVPEIEMRVEFGGRELGVRNIHLLPPAGLSLVREQRKQTVALARVLEEGRTPCVMAGDFNFSPSSAHHSALIDAGMISAWQVRGSGRGATWPRTSWLRYLPGIRLDQVFYSSHLECLGTGVGDEFGSDHAPVWAVFRWNAGRE